MAYGTEIWCDTALRTGRYSRGRQTVVLALLRRISTPRGMLRGGDEESNYGIDLAGMVGAIGYPTVLAALPALIRGELMKDDRVLTLNVNIIDARNTDGSIELIIQIDGTLQDEDEPFALSVSVNETSVTLLGGVAS
jgi:hypothetical protein